MPNTKTAPAPEAETEDTELAEISQSIVPFDEAALRQAMQDEGASAALIELVVGQRKADAEANRRLLQRQQRSDMASYRDTLLKEFPLADAEMLQGSTKRELRTSAERLQRFAERVAQAATKTTAKPDATATRTADSESERQAAWGAPPIASEEVVRETPDRTWDQLRSDAVHKPATQSETTKAAVIADIKENAPRQMRRASLANIASRQATRAAREAAART